MPSRLELSVSNIAFPAGKLEDALALLSQLDIASLEIAPRNVFGRWDVSDAEIDGLRRRLADSGVRCIALQGIQPDICWTRALRRSAASSADTNCCSI